MEKKRGGGNQRREVKIPKKSRGPPRVWVIPLLGLIVSNMSEEEYKPFWLDLSRSASVYALRGQGDITMPFGWALGKSVLQA